MNGKKVVNENKFNFWMILSASLLIIMAFLYFSSPKNTENPQTYGILKIDSAPSEVIPANYLENFTDEEIPYIDRPSYIGINDSMFRKLPRMKADFKQIKQAFQYYRLNVSKLSEEYYLQPEFPFANMNNPSILEIYRNYPTYENIKEGIQSYNAELIAPVDQDGEFEFYFFVYNTYGSISYKGIKLMPVIKSEVTMFQNYFADGTRSVSQDINYVKEHIKILSIEPNEFMLEPAYSIRDLKWNSKGELISKVTEPHFEKNWGRKIRVVVQTKGLKAGKYYIGIDAIAPSKSFNEKMSDQYRSFYSSYGSEGVVLPYPISNLYIVKT